jgi:hypothetical protein
MRELSSWFGSEGLKAGWVRSVCAWCSDSSDTHERASHGICRSCLSERLPVLRPSLVPSALVARSPFA